MVSAALSSTVAATASELGTAKASPEEGLVSEIMTGRSRDYRVTEQGL
jgi:hypothetical protein